METAFVSEAALILLRPAAMPASRIRCRAAVASRTALALLVLAAPTLFADEPAPPPVLEGFRPSALDGLAEESVLHYLGLELGTELTAETVDEALRRLWASGLVDDAKLEIVPTSPGHAVLAVSAVARPLLAGVRLTGVDRLTRTTLEGWMTREDRRPPSGVPVDRGDLDELAADMRELLAAGGRDLRVAYTLVPERPGLVTAEFGFGREPRGARIREIAFPGAEAFRPERLRRAMRRNRTASPT